ncbi:hypothetical protein PUNSTDRAFT_119055 [Punctularia strigosozonata HHB-11173 SS5]|uniref:uncharacterized protein n=1 Tax=Punctularia strigosozonata (strain HHB-11173) TaxID=741275 RepID=UPI0004417601|nr:uncharacterized protein PUNSTDRAFT_119055 [Punctularia strigosozonata HHB-11173 SS5]EIN11823.1 hypothetical protein PUNSTDRAFT_119055 [Punctularia strigosozonata HHB-11173 SS5]
MVSLSRYHVHAQLPRTSTDRSLGQAPTAQGVHLEAVRAISVVSTTADPSTSATPVIRIAPQVMAEETSGPTQTISIASVSTLSSSSTTSSAPSASPSSSAPVFSMPIIIGIAIAGGIVVLGLLFTVIYCCISRRRARRRKQELIAFPAGADGAIAPFGHGLPTAQIPVDALRPSSLSSRAQSDKSYLKYSPPSTGRSADKSYLKYSPPSTGRSADQVKVPPLRPPRPEEQASPEAGFKQMWTVQQVPVAWNTKLAPYGSPTREPQAVPPYGAPNREPQVVFYNQFHPEPERKGTASTLKRHSVETASIYSHGSAPHDMHEKLARSRRSSADSVLSGPTAAFIARNAIPSMASADLLASGSRESSPTRVRQQPTFTRTPLPPIPPTPPVDAPPMVYQASHPARQPSFGLAAEKIYETPKPATAPAASPRREPLISRKVRPVGLNTEIAKAMPMGPSARGPTTPQPDSRLDPHFSRVAPSSAPPTRTTMEEAQSRPPLTPPPAKALASISVPPSPLPSPGGPPPPRPKRSSRRMVGASVKRSGSLNSVKASSVPQPPSLKVRSGSPTKQTVLGRPSTAPTARRSRMRDGTRRGARGLLDL